MARDHLSSHSTRELKFYAQKWMSAHGNEDDYVFFFLSLYTIQILLPDLIPRDALITKNVLPKSIRYT